MRTTINGSVGRRGGAHDIGDLEETLTKARKLLADTSALLELEQERLWAARDDTDDPVRIDKVLDAIKSVNKAMQTVVDIEVKYGLRPATGDGDMDLEAARDEILGRLARLVA